MTSRLITVEHNNKPPEGITEIVSALQDQFGNVDCYCTQSEADIFFRSPKENKLGQHSSCLLVRLKFISKKWRVIGMYPSIPVWAAFKDLGLDVDNIIHS